MGVRNSGRLRCTPTLTLPRKRERESEVGRYPWTGRSRREGATLKQHLIDPEICIRCNTCEATCPINAITHDDNNYVVDAGTCNACRTASRPARPARSTTGSRSPRPSAWTSSSPGRNCPPAPPEPALAAAAADAEAAALFAEAHKGAGGQARAPTTAAKPQGQPVQPRHTRPGQGRGQHPRHQVRHLVGRAPHHPRFRRDALPGARRPEHRRRAARPRRERPPACDAALFRRPARATARSPARTTWR